MSPTSPSSSGVNEQETAARSTKTPHGENGRSAAVAADAVMHLRLEAVVPNPRQPRQTFDETALAALAESIRAAGVMQPILVRAGSGPDQYQLIAGERRLRAARLVPLETIPAIVRDIDDQAAAEWALVENLQREDLNPIERAEAFRELIDSFGLTHQELAERVGLDRSSITNLLRLLELDEPIRDMVRQGSLSMGHARSLLAIANSIGRRRVAEAAVREQWSVRELERRVAAEHQSGASGERRTFTTSPSPIRVHLQDLEEKLGRHLGTRVHIRTGRKKGAGRLIIEFFSLDEFDGLMHRLGFDDDA